MNIRDKLSLNQEALSERGSELADEERKVRLGNATELRTPPPPKGFFLDKNTGELLPKEKSSLSDEARKNLAVKVRFDLQDTARKVLYGYHGLHVPENSRGYKKHHRTCTCTRFLLGADKLQIVHSKEFNSAHFKGVMKCGDAKTCPVCAEVISQRKANEMRTAFNQLGAFKEKMHVSLLTFTAPHNAGDKIEDLAEKIKDALSRFWRGNPATKFKSRYGYKGRITGFEVLYGQNGWHPHFHILIFSDFPLPCTLDENGEPFTSKKFRNIDLDLQHDDWLWILNRWQTCCKAAGLSEPNKYGLDIQDGSAASSYITKFGSDDEILKTKSGKDLTWDIADEITKGHAKTSKNGSSLTPFAMLSAINDNECPKQTAIYKKLFISYAKALKGKSLLKWANGTRELFDLEPQKTDEQILNEEIAKCDYLCDLTKREWKYIIANNLRAEIKQVASIGDVDAIARILHPLYNATFEEFLISFKSRKNGTASIKDNVSDWDYFDQDSQGNDIAVLEKIKPITPAQYNFEFNQTDKNDLTVADKTLHKLHFDKMTKGKIPTLLKHDVKIDWSFVDKCLTGEINEIKGIYEIV